MKNVKSKLSLLLALLCLVFTAQGQVTNPYSSSFEIDLTGTADPQLVLKREVTTGGGGGPTSGSGGTTPITYNYHWNLDAGSGGLEFNSVGPTGTETNALRLNSSSAYFNGNLLSVGNSLSANASGLTVMGNNFSVGTSLSMDASGLTVSGDNLSVGSQAIINATGTTFNNTNFVVGDGTNSPILEVDNFNTSFRTDLKVLGNDLFVTDLSGETHFKVNNAGVVHARTVNVLPYGVPIPDYVFEPGYDLMSIEELDAYIQAHGHLPNIKSAEEYEEVGSINLGELNLKLLEKVEEQSLYAIDLQKQIKELKAELEELKAVLTEIGSKR